jgi:hypothetical protein
VQAWQTVNKAETLLVESVAQAEFSDPADTIAHIQETDNLIINILSDVVNATSDVVPTPRQYVRACEKLALKLLSKLDKPEDLPQGVKHLKICEQCYELWKDDVGVARVSSCLAEAYSNWLLFLGQYNKDGEDVSQLCLSSARKVCLTRY